MVVDEGLLALLRYLLRVDDIGVGIGLFKNDITPDHDTELTDLELPTWDGFTVYAATLFSWPDPAINASQEGESDGPLITWTASSDLGTPEDVHGLFVQIKDDADDFKLLFAIRFTDPITISLTGDTVEKKLNWFDKNLVP